MENIKELLQNGVVEFTFTKANGEERKARGTLCFEYLISTESTGFTEENKPSGSRPTPERVCTYWDLDKKSWRSLRTNTLISITNVIDKAKLLGLNLFE